MGILTKVAREIEKGLGVGPKRHHKKHAKKAHHKKHAAKRTKSGRFAKR